MKDKLKILAWYELAISLIVILFSYSFFLNPNDWFSQGYIGSNLIVALIGVMGGILLLRKFKIGFYLSMIWALLQMFMIQINGINIDFFQIFNITFTLNLKPEVDLIFKFNFIGLLLTLLFIKWRKDLN